MNFAVENEGNSYALTAAILIYTGGKTGHHAIATKHEVEHSADRGCRIVPGQPLAMSDYVNLVKALAPAEQPSMLWHDDRILASGMGRLVWWEPPKRRSLFFKESQYDAKTFNAKGVCSTPGVVFMAMSEPRSLWVWAVKGDKRPTKETLLYQAPFFNVWGRGQVCVGNSTLPGDERKDDPEAWSQAFFGSHFTHPNFTEANRLVNGSDPCEFWKKHLSRKARAFPEDVLVRAPIADGNAERHCTVADVVGLDSTQRLTATRRPKGEF